MSAKRAKPKDNTAAIATQFGVSLKALRLYERLGMLTPPRTGAGWRVYGQVEIERLHAILSLKQLGLPLARIADLLRSGETNLRGLLSIQEEMLLAAREEAEHALTLIRIARARLNDSETLSTDELAALVRKVAATVLRWTPEMDELARRIYTPAQFAKVRGHDRAPREVAELNRFWEEFLAALKALPADCDPASEEALAIGRRFVKQMRKLTDGDKALWNSSARFWRDAMDDPRIAPQLKANMPRHELFGHVLMELHRRGEINL